MTLAGTSIDLNVSGSLTFQATNFTRTYTGLTLFNATTTGKTVTTNGVAFGFSVTFNGVGGGWTLGSAISAGVNTITVTSGTFDTSSVGNYAVTAASLVSSSGTDTRTVNLNNSTVSLAGGSPLTFNSTALFTFNAGTSTINCSNTSAIFAGAGKTFYNVAFTSTALASPSITGANTFNNLSITGRTTVGIAQTSISANQTINGTFTVSAGTAGAYRIMIRSDTVGTARTLTCAAVSLTDVDFRDITAAGVGSPFTGTRLGNCGGNTNITFPAAKTVYYRQTAGGDWGTSGSGSWSATSGGALDATQFPLAQDTAIFPAATYPASGSTVIMNALYNVGTIDMSLRTANTMTFSTSNAPTIYGNWINGTGITLSGATSLAFRGRTTQQITSAGITFPQSPFFDTRTGTVQLQDAFTTGTGITTTLTSGTLDLQSFKLSTGLFSSSNSNTRTIAFGTGSIDCTGTGTVWDTSTTTGSAFTGSRTVNITSTGSTTITVNCGNTFFASNSINFNFTGGTYGILFNAYGNNLDFTGYAGILTVFGMLLFGNLKISTGMSINASTNTIQFLATSGTQQVTTNGRPFDINVAIAGVGSGGTVQLQDAWTISSGKVLQHVYGTLDLNNLTLSVGRMESYSGATRAIAFGTGNITLTLNLNGYYIWFMSSGYTGFTYTGTPTINCSSALAAGNTVYFGPANVFSTNYLLNFNFTSGAYGLYGPYNGFGVNGYTRAINFTGYTGTFVLAGYLYVSGDLTYGASMGTTYQSSSYYLTMYPLTGTTANTTSNGNQTFLWTQFGGQSSNTSINKIVGTYLNQYAVWFIGAKFDLNGQTFTSNAINVQSGVNEITFNGGTITTNGSSTNAFFNNTGTNLTTVAGTGTGTIKMSSLSGKTFTGGGATYNCTLDQAGSGTLTITGSNTFSNITNTVKTSSATTIRFTAGTTNTFTDWNASGEATRLLTIGSSTSASHTLSKSSGTVSADYLSIS
jgi:hypothetical protein